MDHAQERDYDEERYNREFCIPCGTSPCQWDGQPDGFHTDGGLRPDWDLIAQAIAEGLIEVATARTGNRRQACGLAAEAVLATDQIAGSAEDMLAPVIT